MIGAFVVAGYAVLATVLWPWGLLAAGAHLLVLTACIPWRRQR